MRVIAGKWRNHTLLSPEGPQTRPITDMVKEAVFNTLGARLALPGTLPACAVLDMFAGTGSLGIEALSRGARWCTFVEQHRATAQRLMRNIDALGAGDDSEVLCTDAWKLDVSTLSPPLPFAVVFIDPPYRDSMRAGGRWPPAELISRILARLDPDQPVIFVLRYHKISAVGQSAVPGCQLLLERHYGDMTVTYLQRSM